MKGEILLFTDADTIVPSRWISLFVNFVKNKNIDVVGGIIKPYSLSNIVEMFEQNRRNNLYGSKERFVNFLPTCNLAIKRNVFERVGGFDTDFKFASFEDYHLCKKKKKNGYKIFFTPEIVVIHMHTTNLKSLLKKAFIHGRESIKFDKKLNKSLFVELFVMIRIFFLPVLVIEKYKGLSLIGFLYEIFTYLGKISGIIKYRW